MTFNTIDDVLDELDRRFESSSKLFFDNSVEYPDCCGRIEFNGFNFSIAVFWAPYRIETLEGNFLANFRHRDSVREWFEERVKEGQAAAEFLRKTYG